MNIHKQTRKKVTYHAILWIALLCIAIGVNVQAATTPCDPSKDFCNSTQSTEFVDILQGIADWVILIGIPVLIFFTVLSGILFVTAQGNEEKLTRARQVLTWTVVGGFIILGASVIAEVVIDFAESL